MFLQGDMVVTMGGFDLDELRAMLKREFAPWIQMLDIQPISATPDGMKFKMPENEKLARQPDIICGQAIASFADTSVFSHYSHIMTNQDC